MNARPIATIVALIALTLAGASPTIAQLGGPPAGLFEPDALRVFVCGSASPLGNDPKRAQACIGVIAGPRIYLVDTGAGSARNLGIARLPMQNVAAVLLTHFHSDHIADLPGVNSASWIAGRNAPLPVLGPEGVERVVAGFNEAYALSQEYRTAHHGEELLPSRTSAMEAKAIGEGVLLDEDGLKITAFAVDHAPIEPAFGYRFDFAGRSVVISGDTVAVDSLEEASKDVDLLLHDAMALPMVQQFERMVRSAGNERTAKLLKDVQDYHAPTGDIVALAERARVRQVAFYHLVPVPPNEAMMQQFRAGLPEDVIVTKDGMLFELAKDSETIETQQLFN